MAQCKAIVGQQAPPFQCHAIVDGRIKDIALSTYTDSHHWLILVFFPRAWSYICPTEIRTFSARLEEFLYSRSCAVVFASTDSEYCLRAWNGTSEHEGGLGGVHVPLISDASHQLSRDYGVLIEEEGVAQRALFIIDPKGILRSMSVHDADIGRSVDEVQRTLDALAFKDEYGEGCPVNWKRGDKGIDIASKTKVEGAVEVENRKSWTDWARPKLARAFSGTSQVSIGSSINNKITNAASRIPSADAGSLPTLARLNAHDEAMKAARPASYLSPYSPTSSAKHETQLDQAIALMRMSDPNMANEQASHTNNEVGAAM